MSDLPQALQEVRAVFAKYQCGGFATLSNRTHSIYSCFLPDWSAMRPTNNESMLRLAVKDLKDVEDTLHFLIETKRACHSMIEGVEKFESQLTGLLSYGRKEGASSGENSDCGRL